MTLSTRIGWIPLCAALSACMVGPSYHRPTAPTPAAFKEIDGGAPARPSDGVDRGDWWTAFGDPTLDELEARALAANQTLIGAEAAWRQATSLVQQDRAALFPTISLIPSVSTSGVGGGSGAKAAATGATYRVGLDGSWQPDLWGQIHRSLQGAKASAQSSANALANARLSVTMETAVDYVQLRQLDEQTRLLDTTVAGYQRSLTIARNRYNAGVAVKSDVLSAETQLANTQASDSDIIQQRARLEHAIAILTGRPPAEVAIPPANWSLSLPDIPISLPSDLLQRRPDIAQTERNTAAASAQIGVQTTAYYPAVSLTGNGAWSAGQIGQLFNPSSFLWSVAASAAETVFDAGARHARVAGARAAYDQAVANYRQTVLVAFGQVEDNLAAQRVLRMEQVHVQTALAAASANEVITRNQYVAGQLDYTSVVVAQAAAQSARTAELQIEATRLTTAVDLIAALGGGWRASSLGARP